MNIYTFRIIFIYDNSKMVGCFVFLGDGVFIDRRTKLRIGVSTEFEEQVFIYGDNKFSTLFYTLGSILNSVGIITERQLIDKIKSCTDFRATGSVIYEYKYDKLSKQVYKNVLKRNNLVEFVEEE